MGNGFMRKGLAFWICLFISIGLMLGGFFAPPTGVIDGSVLTAVGELFGFAALATILQAIKDHNVKLTHGNTEITIEEDKEDEDTDR